MFLSTGKFVLDAIQTDRLNRQKIDYAIASNNFLLWLFIICVICYDFSTDVTYFYVVFIKYFANGFGAGQYFYWVHICPADVCVFHFG